MEKLYSKIAKNNQELYEKSETYKKEQEAKQEFFWIQGEKVLTEFFGAPVKDILEFAEKLKEWAMQTEFKPSGVESNIDNFFNSKLKNGKQKT